jgi:hypothetical protein
MTAVTTTLALLSFTIGFLWLGIAGAGAGFLVGAGVGLAALIWLARRTFSLVWSRFGKLVAGGLGSGFAAWSATATVEAALGSGTGAATVAVVLAAAVFCGAFRPG